MSLATTVKAYLVGTSGVLAALLPDVTVSYSAPGRVPTDLVYGGSVAGPVALAAFKGGGRMKRAEDLTLLLHVRVYRKGESTTEASDARAGEIADVICIYIAENPTLGDMTDLKAASVSSVGLDEGWLDDDGAGSTLTIGVDLKTYLG